MELKWDCYRINEMKFKVEWSGKRKRNWNAIVVEYLKWRRMECTQNGMKSEQNGIEMEWNRKYLKWDGIGTESENNWN